MSTLTVLVALTAGAFLLLELYERQLISSLDTTLQQQVDDRVRLLDAGSAPDAIATVLQEESFVWVGSAGGSVVAEGGAIRPLENPIPRVIGAVDTVTLLVEEIKPDEVETERMEVRIASGSTSAGTVVLAGAELDSVDKPVRSLTSLFLVAVPLIAALVGVLAWFTTGQALRPVENIRSQAMEISGSTLAERVPVPVAHDEVRDLAVSVNAMLDRLHAHDTAIRQFGADASHELKSPVANIRAMVETADVDDPAWPDVRDRIVGETSRLQDLVSNLLFLATHQDGARIVTEEVVPLDELVFAEAEVVSASGRVRVELSGVAPATVTGSRDDLARLVRNLVDNAARHANERISVAVAERDGSVVLD
ncbi:MAG: histidine kinase dimerization/phospho-acceptor domain-containing protein, partial [Acidimicrobiales bacterium]